MKGKKILLFTCLLCLVLMVRGGFSFGAQQPSHEEIEQIIEEVAREKQIPAVILKAIAWKESKYTQFDSKGRPYVSRGYMGIMQISPIHKYLDQERLKYDIRYNIAAGADILLGRWYQAGTIYPTIGDMDPNVLEHWYFALWGYNGWLSRNNPNVSGEKAYQEVIFQIIREKYHQPITSIDPSKLPKTGVPKASLKLETPIDFHLSGEDIVFKDLLDHPQRDSIEALFEMGIVSGVDEDTFMPDAQITHGQALKILIEGLALEEKGTVATDLDLSAYPQWAHGYIRTALDHGMLTLEDMADYDLHRAITREEAIRLVEKALPTRVYESGEIDDIFSFYNDKEMKDPVSRGEMCEWMLMIISVVFD